MAFVRRKKSETYRGYTWVYHLVENRRVDGKVHQKVLAYLGGAETPGQALWATVDDLDKQLRREMELAAKQASESITLSDRLALDRARRKIVRILGRIRILERYAEKPTPDPRDEFRDAPVQRTWELLGAAYQEALMTDGAIDSIGNEIDPRLKLLVGHIARQR